MDEIVAKFKEKYADVINDLLTKYGGTIDKGFDYLLAMLRAWENGEEPLYTTELEVNREEMLADYKEYLNIAEKVTNEKGIN